jgi:hypothetical protein
MANINNGQAPAFESHGTASMGMGNFPGNKIVGASMA